MLNKIAVFDSAVSISFHFSSKVLGASVVPEYALWPPESTTRDGELETMSRIT